MRSHSSIQREQVARKSGGATAAAIEHHGLGHVVSPLVLIAVFAILMVLTILTVAITSQDFGYNINLMVAIGIAVIKATLVVLYFMHLRWDSIFYSIIVLACLLFVGIFIIFTIIDTGQYHGNLFAVPAP